MMSSRGIIGLAAAMWMAAFPNGVIGQNQTFLILPSGFTDAGNVRVTRFAQGLDYPGGMIILDESSVWVAVNEGDSFFNCTGAILLLEDDDGDGVADGAPTRVISGLPGGLTALRRHGPWLMTISTNPGRQALTLFRILDSRNITPVGKIQFPIDSSYHLPSALAVRQTPGADDDFEVYFQYGSRENFSAGAPLPFTSDLGLSGQLEAAALHRVLFSRNAEGTFTADRHDRIATGLRNAAGLTFHPLTGDLIILENGIDGVEDSTEPTSADEINFISPSQLGGIAENFGFPDSYAVYRTGEFVGNPGTRPLLALHPIPNPSNGAESEGGSSITAAPANFPFGYNNGFFAGFHGQFSSAGEANEENPVLYIDLNTGQYSHFIPATQPGVGHINGMDSNDTTMVISDMASGGNLFTSPGTGVIYMFHSTAPPVRRADLSISLRSLDPPRPPQPGDLYTLGFNIRNRGPFAATDVVLQAVIPEGLTAQQGNAEGLECSEDSNLCRWLISEIQPDALTSLSVPLVFSSAIDPGPLQISFAVTSAIQDPAAANNQTSWSVSIIRPVPAISFVGDGLQVTWNGSATAEISQTVDGPWFSTGDSTSPLVVDIPNEDSALFIRLTW
jgi:uncharacterized repeat protein (TIGR01451 family)